MGRCDSDASMTERCEMLLSPGTVISLSMRGARVTFQWLILFFCCESVATCFCVFQKLRHALFVIGVQEILDFPKFPDHCFD